MMPRVSATPRIAGFRRRLLSRDLIVGTFLKTPDPAVMEILALSGLDCVCVDTEHAPFDRRDLAAVLLAARAHDFPSLVRIRGAEASECLNALDLGATGIIAPHVSSPEIAARIANACRFQPDGRGYAGSTRSAGYTTRPIAEIIAQSNAEVCVIAQIEDAKAVADIDQIAAVPGVDALFVGPMDLTVSLGAAAPQAPPVLGAVKAVCDACVRRGRIVGMFTQNHADARRWQAEGSSFFLLGSDQQWILAGARDLRAAFAGNA